MYSIVIPIFNEEKNIMEMYRRLHKVCKTLDASTEIIFVNDGSKDNSADEVLQIRKNDQQVKLINFSRNFGHQIAVSAGLDFASGDSVVIIDADLQDPPEVIPNLVAQWKAGYEVVYAVRKKREGDSAFKKFTAWAFYRLLNSITGIAIPVDTGDFRLIDKKVVVSIRSLSERHRFLRGLVSWVGFKQIGVEYEREARFAGSTKYPLKKMLRFAFDAITSFSHVPLQMATFWGFIVSFIAFAASVFFLYLRFFTNNFEPGFTSIILAILFLGGIQLITLGTIGEYLGRIYDEIKARPLYLIAEKFGFEE